MTTLSYLAEWPAVRSQIPRRADDEALIARLVEQMTVEEKIGQMIQPELAELTPDDVRDYKIGSALNGAGIWPGNDRRAGVELWRKTVAEFRDAAEEAYRDRPFTVPFVWATDAVHGHNNVYGATIFPHNIGLGAARDPDLIRRIGAATAQEIAATGMGWTFAPTVATPRDRRWGRYYEGYSEDPEIVSAYAREMVRGLQGDAESLRAGRGVIATLKHWVADGATEFGADRGVAKCSEDLLRNIHAAGFLSGIEAGAQAVMVSFSSWYDEANYDHTPGRDVAYNHKVHGSKYLINDVLKDKIGFDGIVISDWDAHAEIAGCDVGHARYAIQAGLDVLMVAGRGAWQSVWHDAVAAVREGDIPLARIDDAVSRVLRVKLRAGLFERAADAALPPAGSLGSPEHRALSREAARKSAVLLKNAGGVLPLSPESRVLVAGSGADDIQKQTGGWTLSWQGDDITLDDLPGAATVATAIRGIVGDARATVDPWLRQADPAAHDVAVVVIGEDSYAEMRGTIKPWRSLAYSELKSSYARDTATLRALHESGVPVVTILLTGRPLYTTDEINLSDAFVVGWLPGPHGEGLTDVLFEGPHDFQGRLAGSWPARKDSMAVNRIPPHIPGYVAPPEEVSPTGEHTPLFAYGSGLSLADDGDIGVLPGDDSVDTTPAPAASGPIEVPGDDFVLRVGGHNTWSREDVPLDAPMELLIVHSEPVAGGGLSLRFNGYPAFVYAQSRDGAVRDLRGYAEQGGRLTLRARVLSQPDRPLYLACHDDFPAQPGLDLSARLAELDGERWHDVEIPLSEIAGIGTDLRHVDVPFMLYTDGRAHLEIADVRWVV